MNAGYDTDIIYFDVRDPEFTKAYVFLTAKGDCPYFIQGWHCRYYPSDVTTEEILRCMFVGPEAHSYVSWPQCEKPELPE